MEWPGDADPPVSLRLPKCRADRHAATPACEYSFNWWRQQQWGGGRVLNYIEERIFFFWYAIEINLSSNWTELL